MTTDPTPTLAELEERVRGGDTTVTAQQLADAAQADRLAALQQEATQRAQDAEDARSHKAAVDQLHADYAKLQGKDSAAARKAYTNLVAAMAELHAALDEFSAKRVAIRDRASELGVPLQFADWLRIPEYSADTYINHAAREARGEYWPLGNSPHGLHTDKQVAEYEERQQEMFRLEEERRAKAMENAETMVELGYGNYTRRVEV